MIHPRLARSVLDRLHSQLIVSVQADDGSPLRDSRIIAALACAAELGGAAGLRVRSAEDIRAVQSVSALPLIGLTKTWRDDTDVYITPTPAEAEELAGLGCAMVAFDATRRPRPHSVPELIGAIQAAGALALADVATLAEAAAALHAGADLVSTALSGYTPDSPQQEAPDFELMQGLHAAGIPFLAEGRLKTPADAVRALELGAHAVVVGSAITRPDDVTRWFTAALRDAAGQVATR